MPPCLIGIEAGMATHSVARELAVLGHDVKQVPPAFSKPFRRCGAMDFSIADDGERTGHEQAAQIAVTLLADMAKPVLAPARMLLRHKPNSGREVAP